MYFESTSLCDCRIEPSFGFSYTSLGYGVLDDDVNYINFTPAVYGTWSFHFSHEFRAYGAVGLGWNIGTVTGDYDFDVDADNRFYWDVAAGVFYDVASALSLRGEVGYGGLKAGIALLF